MIRNGAAHQNRLLAILLAAVMLMTTCFTPALAADIWSQTTLSLLWTDADGVTRIVPATPVEGSGDPAYWVNIDPAAYGQYLTVEVSCPDPSYDFYLMGGDGLSFTWDVDAKAVDSAWAYALGCMVDGVPTADILLLYVSSMPMPEQEEAFVPFPVQVAVNYVADEGVLLDTQYVECWAGSSTTVRANSAYTEGYALNGSDSVEVYVDEAGTATPYEVTFRYSQIATPTPEPTEEPTPTPIPEAIIPVYYYHADGTLLDMQEVTLNPGTHNITPNSSRVEGYVLTGDSSVTINVYEDGSSDVASVVFQYETPAPAEAIIPVYYYHADGTLLDMQEVTLNPGTHTITPNSSRVEGYVLTGDSAVTVNVYEDGSTDVASVVFQYETPAPAEAIIPVYYYHADGTLLDMQEVTLNPGTHTITPNSSRVEGYVLTGDSAVTINVYEDGSSDVASVVFQYDTPAPTEAIIPVYYYHADGTLLDMQEVTLTSGAHTITPNSSRVEGYVLTGDSSVTINVYEDGSTDVASVVFQYDTPAPAEAVIPVYYYREDGTLLDIQEIPLTPGTHTIYANSAKVEGLVLTTANYAEVTVYNDGTTSAAGVQFIYAEPEAAPVEAAVTVNYIHIDRGVLDTQTITLGEGVHTITASSDKVSACLPLGSDTAEVTVYADGTIHPGTVDFYYEDAYVAPVTAELTILYQLEDGTPIAQDTMTLTPGSHTIEPDSSRTAGYALAGDQAFLIVVDEQGNISQSSVLFICQKATVTITVHYQDDRGRDVAPDQTRTFAGDGTYTIKAEPEGLSAEYELAPGLSSQETITVSGGRADRTDVYFYYQQKQATTTVAHVTVCYFDLNGEEIAPAQTIDLIPGIHQVNASSAETFKGYVLVSEPSITVEVYENGTFSPQEVAFYYRLADTQVEEATATVTIYYRDDRGNDVAAAQTITLADGTHVIQAAPADLQAGYEIFEGTDSYAEVTVRDGVPSRAQVVFYYQKAETQPTVFTLPVNYYDTEGRMIATTQYVQVGAGTYAIQANPVDLPEGYELMMSAVLTVVVNRDGTTDPEEIAFYYRAPEKKATVIVSYVDENGQAIAQPYTVELSAGYHTLQADASRVPSGYDPDSAEPVKLYVSPQGEANPAQAVFTFERLVVETPIPVGEYVYRYAKVTSKSVAFRSEPSTSGGNKTVIKRLGRSDEVYVLQELYNEDGELWSMINYNGRTGYMMSEFLSVMTQAESDEYGQGHTPVPTFTPAPTATPYVTATPTLEPLPTEELVQVITPPPTEVPTVEPTPTETASPTPTPTATPVPTPSPTPYTGYALTTRATALRTGISASDMTIIHDMEANTLVHVVNQISDPVTGKEWSIISTLSNQAGFVLDASLRYISDKEAEPYLLLWEEQNREPDPTQLITATPEPMQVEGYGVVLGDGVPFRQMQSEFSRIIDNLDAGTIVYISGQTAGEGQYWHSVNYDGRWGYIRTDLVRMLTIAEEEEYLESLKVTPAPATTNVPFDADGLSSYGYVDGSSVNWREGPSTSEKKVGELRRYAFCLVLGTEYNNGVTWYHVKYGDQTGYIHGDFFKQMTISELEDFLGSEEYLQGVTNNSPDGDAALDNVGYTGTGGLVSAEDEWVYNNSDLIKNTMSPWEPIATVAPIATATPTLEPLPGVTATPYITPTPTPTFNPMPDVTYPTSDDGEGGSAVVWVVVIGLLVLAVGGAFALVRYQQNRRRIALRAAQRRAQAARAQQQQQQRPYARTAAPNQPRTGAYPSQQAGVQQSSVQRPAHTGVNQSTSPYTPYSAQNSYAPTNTYRPADSASAPESGTTASSMEGTTQRNPRVGRRTAYRQAQENANQSGENNTFDA